MYDGHVTEESLIEAANYAVQTVTTVGYGNWENPALQQTPAPPDWPARVLVMRAWSALYMLLGASIFTALTGVVVAIFVKMVGY